MEYNTQKEYEDSIFNSPTKNRVKPVVHYNNLFGDVSVGKPASLYPIDHPNKCLNGQWAITSVVVDYDEESGEIETLYTRYAREQKQ